MLSSQLLIAPCHGSEGTWYLDFSDRLLHSCVDTLLLSELCTQRTKMWEKTPQKVWDLLLKKFMRPSFISRSPFLPIFYSRRYLEVSFILYIIYPSQLGFGLRDTNTIKNCKFIKLFYVFVHNRTMSADSVDWFQFLASWISIFDELHQYP